MQAQEIWGACDWSTDVQQGSNNTYIYTKDCHLEVGKAVKTNSLLDKRLDELQKQIDLKDLQITKYDERTKLWMDTSFQLNDKLQSYNSLSNNEKWIAFGIGMGLAFVSVWAAGQLVK